MIPKTIHYCWFGRNEKSGLITECINSWKKHMPDYNVIEWNEDNFDVNMCPYTKEAYEAKKWAFVSDYARLYALYTCGGVYLDTDVEALRPLDMFLDNKAFTGYEVNDSPVTAVMGAEKGNTVIKELLDYYQDKRFLNPDGSINAVTNTQIISEMLSQAGFVADGKQKSINGLVVYPQIYFCPNNISRIWMKPSSKSYTIHHFDSSWTAKEIDEKSVTGRIKRYTIGFLRNHIGSRKYAEISRMIKARERKS